MSRVRVKLGRRGEELAVQALRRRGYEVLTRNWTCRAGEVDVVARRDGAWYFYEVRTRRGRAFGAPEESVTPAKEERMVGVALAYLAEHELDDVDWRVGLVAIEMDHRDQVVRLEVYESFT